MIIMISLMLLVIGCSIGIYFVNEPNFRKISYILNSVNETELHNVMNDFKKGIEFMEFMESLNITQDDMKTSVNVSIGFLNATPNL